MRSPLFAGYAVLFSKAVTSGFQRSKDIFRAIFINIENLTVHMLRNIRVTIQVLQQHFIGAGNDALTRDIDNCKERRIRISNSFVEFFAKSAASVNRNAGNPLRLHTCHCTMCVGIRSSINQIVAITDRDNRIHMHSFPWEQMMNAAVSMGYRSHQATTCGLHVHISRDAFGRTEQAQEAAIARLLFFVEKHWNELLKFSRRTNRQLERWAARYGYKDTPKEMMDHAKSYHYGRYTCVNLTNTDTVEIRIFRGTLKYNTFIATLQLVNRLCDVAIYLTDSELHAMSWSDFTAGITEPELIQYLKERRLYLNEPVESEVEL